MWTACERSVKVFDRTQDAVIAIPRGPRRASCTRSPSFSFDIGPRQWTSSPEHTSRADSTVNLRTSSSFTVMPPRDLEAVPPAPRHAQRIATVPLGQVHPARALPPLLARQALRRRARRHRRHRVDGARRFLTPQAPSCSCCGWAKSSRSGRTRSPSRISRAPCRSTLTRSGCKSGETETARSHRRCSGRATASSSAPAASSRSTARSSPARPRSIRRPSPASPCPSPSAPAAMSTPGPSPKRASASCRVEKALGGGRYDRIVRMIEESEKLKSTAEDKASRLADRLVPYTLGGTALTYLITRNVTKMLAVLMVDFSCALKLSMPIAVLSAMRESSSYHISVKGGRFLEAVAKANTVVFDKTGTLDLRHAQGRAESSPSAAMRTAKCCAWPRAWRSTIPIPSPTPSWPRPGTAD